MLCLFEFIVMFHHLWDPLLPLTPRRSVMVPFSFIFVFVCFSVLLLCGNSDRLTGMANVGVLWTYVLVCLAAADEVDREDTDSE